MDDAGYYPGSQRKRREMKFEAEYIPDPWRDNYTERWINNEKVRLYTIGSFAEALGVSVQTIRAWTKDSRIPGAPFRLPSNMVVRGEKGIAGRRLYTAEVIDATVDVLREHGLLGRNRIVWDNYPQLTIEIRSAWIKAEQKRRINAS